MSSSSSSAARPRRPRYVSLRLAGVEWRGPGSAMLRYRVLGAPLAGEPGQFAMFWVPGLEAIPLAPLRWGEELVFLVRERGETTRRLVRDPPLYAGAVAPLGSPAPWPRAGPVLVLAGGVGVAAAAPLAARLSGSGLGVTLVYGARSAAELAPVEGLVGGARLVHATEDGSRGLRGTVIDAAERLGAGGFGAVYAAGPNAMICAVYRWASERGLLGRLVVAPERVVRCGLGFCGGCALPGSGLLLCREGGFVEAWAVEEWVGEGCPS